MGEGLYRDAAMARFYDLDNGWTGDRAFCLRLAAGKGAVLDLGCGTGDLAIRIAAEHGSATTGVDPARAMLEIARSKKGAERVRWVEADARWLDLSQRFDLIVMTGHVFQVLLTDEDRAQALAAVARHLAPGGRFVFDSRNPARREWEEWQPDLSRRGFDDPELGPVTAWDEADWDAESGVLAYRTTYRVAATGAAFSAGARIAFPGFDRVGAQIATAGLAVESWLGDWEGAAPGEDSPEFIAICRHARGSAE
ncbi:MAG: class I SAM-dependent methyltransferase [Rhodobacteraceae bacterium]|nr:class I SAM-dependent methyltransferase [Paracoccaceae bacterium]MCP5342142.1 class I SAM-dependent methyltransferase [Paracoccaceae bacterium]